MKKILVSLALACAAMAAFAEPTFDQMQDLIAQKNYAAASAGLETIIAAHPNSAKAYYSMAQAQAGLGHLDKAQFALNKATGLDPTLKFATAANVEALRTAITPQVAKIQKVESGFNWLIAFLVTLGFAIVGYIAYVFYRKDKGSDDNTTSTGTTPPVTPSAPSTDDYFVPAKTATQNWTARTPTPPRTTPRATTARKPLATQSTSHSSYSRPPAAAYVPPTPAVVNNHYGSNNSGDLVTGMVLGSMLSDHHDHTRVVEREVIREVPASRSTRSSSWDDTPSSPEPTPSRSSSWDSDDSSSKSASSWSSSSSDSSSSSSSWDSGSSSSSSDSSSSSSWD